MVEGDGPEQLKKGVGHAIYSANPGETGNVVLSAHNDIQGEIFRDLDQLEEGDLVILFSERKSYTYVVQEVHIVEPYQVEFLESTDESIATLISCYPYMIDNTENCSYCEPSRWIRCYSNQQVLSCDLLNSQQTGLIFGYLPLAFMF